MMKVNGVSVRAPLAKAAVAIVTSFVPEVKARCTPTPPEFEPAVATTEIFEVPRPWWMLYTPADPRELDHPVGKNVGAPELVTEPIYRSMA